MLILLYLLLISLMVREAYMVSSILVQFEYTDHIHNSLFSYYAKVGAQKISYIF
jgi:hypothetical protein